MAVSDHLIVYCSLLFFFLVNLSIAKTSFKPKALVLPVSKDASTLQYVTHIKQRTPPVPVKLTLDLGGQSMWVDCDHGYVSSSLKNVSCKSPECSFFYTKNCGSECSFGPKPTCNRTTCTQFTQNSVTYLGSTYRGEVGLDVVSIQSTDGSNPGSFVSVKKFIFICGYTPLLKGLAKGVKGMAGLGNSNTSLPSIFSAAFGFPRKFAICLPSSSKANGVVLIGNDRYVLLPNVDVSKSLIHTPLIVKPRNTAPVPFVGEPSFEYFIKLQGIKINGKAVPLNATSLSINEYGVGGTKISTTKPYTVMRTTIYKAFISAFSEDMAGVQKVAAEAPFGLCFNSTNIGSTRVGPAVPPIDFVMHRSKVVWRIHGANSMVQVKREVLCLGFVDGGVDPWESIVIGGHQLEDNLLQFDIAASKLGFSSSLLFRQTTCANFNFTSKP